MAKGYVYLLEERSLPIWRFTWPTGYYKIGYTSDSVKARISGYTTGNPRELRIVHSIHVKNARVIEGLLHDRFIHKRMQAGGGTEWFKGWRWQFKLAMNSYTRRSPRLPSKVLACSAVVLGVCLVIYLMA